MQLLRRMRTLSEWIWNYIQDGKFSNESTDRQLCISMFPSGVGERGHPQTEAQNNSQKT